MKELSWHPRIRLFWPTAAIKINIFYQPALLCVVYVANKLSQWIIFWAVADTLYISEDMTVWQDYVVHYELANKEGFHVMVKWWLHYTPAVESSSMKRLWDFTIQTNQHLPHNRPDIVCISHQCNTAFLQLIDAYCVSLVTS